MITVSRVVNDHAYVKTETREKILKVIKELNYHPNTFGRGLIKNKVNIIGLVTVIPPEQRIEKHSYFLRLLRGIEDACVENSHDILVCTSNMKYTRKNYLSLYYQRKVDGFIFVGMKIEDSLINEIVSASIPVVVVSNRLNKKGIDSIDCENTDCIFDLVNKVCKLGHKKIAFMKVRTRNDNVEERFRAYKKALRHNGIEFNPDYVLKGNYYTESGYQVTREILEKKDRPTVIICSTDRMAMGAMSAARELGFRIPEDISITGFDGDAIGGYVTPTLATLNQPLEEMGFEAADLLFKRINNPEKETEFRLYDVDFIEGGSLGKNPG